MRRLQVGHGFTELTYLHVKVFFLLQDLLASVHGTLKLIHHRVEGRIGTCRPLESLPNTELLTADLVQDRGKGVGDTVTQDLE